MELTKDEVQQIFFILLLLLLCIKLFMEAFWDKYPPRFGHNTGVIVVVGILCSYVLFTVTDDIELLKDLRFSEEIFFNLILPAIVFPSGYNMRRKKFFRNIKTIMKFGFFATIVCFSIYTAALYGVFSAGLLTKWSEAEQAYVPLQLTIF